MTQTFNKYASFGLFFIVFKKYVHVILTHLVVCQFWVVSGPVEYFI